MINYLILIAISFTLAQAQLCRNGTCRAGECEQLPNATVTCHCPINIKGRECDQPLLAGESLCLSNPCWNGGSCSVLNRIAVCSCPNPFIGANCRERASCANNNPCKNRATCLYFFEPVCFCSNGFTGRYCESLELTGDNTVLVKNKGGYTAKVLFTYTNSEGTFLDGKSLLNGQQYTFKYKGPAISAQITVDALAYSKNIFTEEIVDKKVCYDLYGTLPNPKYTRMNCKL